MRISYNVCKTKKTNGKPRVARKIRVDLGRHGRPGTGLKIMQRRKRGRLSQWLRGLSK